MSQLVFALGQKISESSQQITTCFAMSTSMGTIKHMSKGHIFIYLFFFQIIPVI